MRTWHDYHLTGFAVDGTQQRITLNVSWPYESATELRRAVLVFSGVAGYFFAHDLGKNMVVAMLKTAGFDVVDLGTDVSAEEIVEAVSTQTVPAVAGDS